MTISKPTSAVNDQTPERQKSIALLSKNWHFNMLIHRLIYPSVSLKNPLEAERRRSKLLALILLTILLLTILILVVVFVTNAPGSLRRSHYTLLILVSIVIILLAYRINHTGHYSIAVSMLLVCALLGPWGSLILDPEVLQGDFVPLTYVLIPVLLSSILVHPAITIGIALFQISVLLLIPSITPVSETVNWVSFLIFVFLTSILSILANIISRQDLDEIDRQTHLLIKSESQMRELSIRDHITNLFNRRYMDETLEREILRAKRHRLPVGIMIMDIDYFKQYNDTMGHEAGDILLKEFAKLLSTHVRDADIACRFGGDEFVLVMPGASQKVTMVRAELLCEHVRQLQFTYMNKTQSDVTVSIGVSSFPKNGSTGELILKSADTALFQAKEQGRDRVVGAVSLNPNSPKQNSKAGKK
ncbi:MAG: GGDEF domain-containing protein [Anaerolineaceae bacterium]|nr:GGDEF domain-containing protein [Anaerolineaceae bacterium]